MAPVHSRQLLTWTLPTIAVLLSYLWFKRKRIGHRSDTTTKEDSKEAEKKKNNNCSILGKEEEEEEKLKNKEEDEKEEVEVRSASSTPNKSFSRSLSGVESTPIDIIIPPELRATKSTPAVISDEDLDLEIEKIKSMKNGNLFKTPEFENKERELIEKTTTAPVIVAIKKENKMVNITPKIKKSKKNNNKKNSTTETNLKKTMEHLQDKLVDNNNQQQQSDENSRRSCERDSANHSPSCDVIMLASPSLSSISDNHSENSSDSGKGGSDLATPPPSRTPAIDSNPLDIPTVYEFLIPQVLVGKLIGKHGCFVTQIKDKTNAMIIVKKDPSNVKMKVCTIEGTIGEIERALKMIRDKFPVKRFPELSLEQVHFGGLVSTVPLIPDHLYLKLIEGINNDTILSCMVAPNHLFLQQPTHPSYPGLSVLSSFMYGCYTDSDNSPLLPTPIPENTICAAYSVDGWYRAMVLSTDEQSDTSYVRFLDYGGFAYVENTKLRQIRQDFMLLPFQAAECILANVRSVKEDGTWPEEAYSLVADVTKGSLIYTQIADYTEDGVPLVLCYVVVGPKSVVFLNQHLVDQGHAEWFTAPPESGPDEEGAVGGQ